MRILHVTPTFLPSIGGIENVVDCLSRESLRRGIQADVAHVAAGLPYDEHVEAGRTVYRVPTIGHDFAGFAPRLGAVSRRYDLLHVHDPQLLALTANLRVQAPRVPAVLSTHGGYRHTGRFRRAKALHEKFLLARMLGHYRAVLATSTNDQAYFSAFSDRVQLAENGIDVDRFAQLPQRKRSLWRWLYWGRIARHKRLDLVCDLARRARAMGFPIELTICGPASDGSHELMAQTGEDPADAIRLLPAQNDAALMDLLAASGVFVTASEHEGFGLTILEAMAAGLAVIARDIPPINGLVTERTGLLLGFGDRAADDEALRGFLSDMPERGAAFGRAARSVAESYGWSRRLNAFLEAYRRLCAPAATPLQSPPSQRKL